jgi:hypothetical protein
MHSTTFTIPMATASRLFPSGLPAAQAPLKLGRGRMLRLPRLRTLPAFLIVRALSTDDDFRHALGIPWRLSCSAPRWRLPSSTSSSSRPR